MGLRMPIASLVFALTLLSEAVFDQLVLVLVCKVTTFDCGDLRVTLFIKVDNLGEIKDLGRAVLA